MVSYILSLCFPYLGVFWLQYAGVGTLTLSYDV